MRHFSTTVIAATAALGAGGSALAQEAPASGTLDGPFEGAIEMQDENSVLVSDLMDANVYNPENDSIGKIMDVIVTLDGEVEGAILGVGGFLGIGQKNVAVEMDQFAISADGDRTPCLVLNTTTDALMAAPEFISVQDRAASAEQERLQREMDAAPAPGTGIGAPPASPPTQ
jgi:hypothetical protein